MPELPSVEVICRGLQQHLPGLRVLQITTGSKKLRLPMPRKDLAAYIRGARIKAVDRRAKFLLITMDNGAQLIIHLGMTGRLGIFPKDCPKAKHDHFHLHLDNSTQLIFNDIRRFGFIQVHPPGLDFCHTMLANLGPEPFGQDFTPQHLQKMAAGKNRPLKNFLMDNRVVVGIGNIYACEILFHAGLNPNKRVCSLTKKQWTEIVKSSRYVLEKAIKSGGTTISDFVNESGKSGYFQLELQTYGRQGKPCGCCATPINKITMGGRSTFFCPKCQK
ncbi:MAG: bifunctional DNA-formamidopyrimidine glycosylase/DNA-(apurinic or apyrimidinic site) lyase [Deltaproteobacteria bacterium]|nr:bifunctional DNA-formamidopyrimidine glycosylase/DNA-(apurinic or apyrimidinic site) lyase [Deltaproteobacteria bacterium]